MDEASDMPTKRRIDGVTAIMVVVTAASLLRCRLAPDTAGAGKRADDGRLARTAIAAARPGDV